MDASALIGLGERHYPEHVRVFAPIWEFIYGSIDAGNVISVDFVETELNRRAAEWRDAFLNRAKGMFLISQDIEREYGQLIGEIESTAGFLVNKSRERFMSGADIWVMALARNINACTVVSAETKPLSDYGLGEVCKKLDIRHINLIDFFEENKIGH